MTEPQPVLHPSLAAKETGAKQANLRRQAIGILNRKILIELYRVTGLPLFAKDGVYRIIIRFGGWRYGTALVSNTATVLFEANGIPVGKGANV